MPEALYNVYVWDYNRPALIESPIIFKHLSHEQAIKLLEEYWAKGPSWDGFLVLASEDENSD